jgi:uncharacterized protein
MATQSHYFISNTKGPIITFEPSLSYNFNMPRTAIIFHGTGCKPADFWYPWLGKQLKKKGFRVEIPSYPLINKEPISDFLPKVLSNHNFDDETVLIGHSAGATLILSILQTVKVTLPQAVLVAGFSSPIPGDEVDPILQQTYDWGTIKNQIKNITFINSVNDPWGCDDVQGRAMFDKLGGTQIIRQDGHFGSNARNQPYQEFELLNQLIN